MRTERLTAFLMQEQIALEEEAFEGLLQGYENLPSFDGLGSYEEPENDEQDATDLLTY